MVNNFTIWEMRYKAIAKRENFLKIMQGTENESAQSSTPTTAETTVLKCFRKQNDHEISHLLLSVTTLSTRCLKIAWSK